MPPTKIGLTSSSPKDTTTVTSLEKLGSSQGEPQLLLSFLSTVTVHSPLTFWTPSAFGTFTGALSSLVLLGTAAA